MATASIQPPGTLLKNRDPASLAPAKPFGESPRVSAAALGAKSGARANLVSRSETTALGAVRRAHFLPRRDQIQHEGAASSSLARAPKMRASSVGLVKNPARREWRDSAVHMACCRLLEGPNATRRMVSVDRISPMPYRQHLHGAGGEPLDQELFRRASDS